MHRAWLAVLLLTALSPAAANADDAAFARDAVPIWSRIAGSGTPVVVPSPDRRSVAVARWHPARHKALDDEGVEIATRGAIGDGKFDIDPGVGSEISWAPDSRAFFVSSSDGGAGGAYHLKVVRAVGGNPVLRDLTPIVTRAFGHPVKCGWPEVPNVVGIRWLGSDRILAAAQVVPHSNCDSFGTFKAYVVEVSTGRILQTFDQPETKQRFFADLGYELRNANDLCVRVPRRCYVGLNHPRD